VPQPSTSPAADGSPWRLVILDRDPADPKWIIATVIMASDVRAAELDPAGRYTAWQQTTRWVAAVVGHDVTLLPIHDALAWRLDERRPTP
jgi:hypothetical protein